MNIILEISLRQLLSRKRQSLVSFFGIVLGVAFFLAVSSLMKGSERDFLARLVDNSPHITISDEYRAAREQPIFKVFDNNSALQVHKARPLTERRGIRNYKKIVEFLNKQAGVVASPVLMGQGIISYAGKDFAVTLNGMIPEDVTKVTTIQNYLIEGSLEELLLYTQSVVIGAELKRILAISLGDNITLVSPTGSIEVLKVVGVFKTGRSNQDTSQLYLPIKKVQALLNKPFRANTIIMKIANPHDAREYSKYIESVIGYKAVSWQETSEDLMNTIGIRNKIMYTVVSAVLIVAAFGIYNVISTVVMEKYRDIAILKSMGFFPSDIRRIFAIQGLVLGSMGCLFGLPLGIVFMKLLGQIKIKPPGSSQVVNMPIDWGVSQFLIAASFALLSAFIASYLPARKAGNLEPVLILRGGAW